MYKLPGKNIFYFSVALMMLNLWPGELFAVVLDQTGRHTMDADIDSSLTTPYQRPQESLENGNFFQLSFDSNNSIRSTQRFDLADDMNSGQSAGNMPSRRDASLSDSSLFEQNIGSFLENMNDSPTLKTIYFNSRQLQFNFQSKLANEIGDLVGDDLSLDHRLFQDNSDSLGGNGISSQSARYSHGMPLLDQIMDSLQSLGAIIILFFALIYLAFRYVLNKYV
ncbi:hypothetical protein [Emcibacter sp.]|uniref:hypothetical protein n=1 Tax=Emcibacter sp. TaxID=1979954 RepID=UPI002AA942A9|nr:hypothetical protein [Emcibacter sp.]